MSRRPVRFLLIAVGLLATAGLGYRAWRVERDASSVAAARAASDRAAADALEAVADLRAALHGQVAAGQDPAPWMDRAGRLLDTLRQRVLALDAALADHGGSMAESLDGLDQLTSLQARARLHLTSGEMLLAADLVFAEGQTLLGAVRRNIAAAKTALDREQARRAEALQVEQAALAAAAVGVWLLVALTLAPVPGKGTPQSRPGRAEDSGIAPAPSAVRAGVAAPGEAAREAPGSPAPAALGGVAPAAREVPEAPRLSTIAEVCADLASLSDIGALTGALARAADALDATGLIVWVASNDGSRLSPVAVHGYDARLVKRIGALAREADNLTAAAFREGTVRIGAAQASRPGALAAALCGPSGTLGVLSVELRAGVPADSVRAAVVSILAAQLSTLALPVPPALTAEAGLSRPSAAAPGSA